MNSKIETNKRRAWFRGTINTTMKPSEPRISEESDELPDSSPSLSRVDSLEPRIRNLGLMRLAVTSLSLAALVCAWWVMAVLGHYPAYILPTPLQVASRLWGTVLDGSLIGSNPGHVWRTISEAGLGFMLALVLGVSFGYIIAHSRLLERILSPYIAISQGLPVIALAPLLAIWVRDDLLRKVIVVALIVFFPILVNTILAVRGIERSMYEVARISGANRLQTIYYVELPLGLRSLLGGVKLGVTLAITGAVIGEFISGGSGLGFLLIQGRDLFDTSLVFVGLVSLAVLTVVVYSIVSFLEKALITWE